MHTPNHKSRRRFLQYFVGSSAVSLTASWLWPTASLAQDELEELCLQYPENSQCENYLPGTAALDESDEPYEAAAILATATAGDRLLANGLDKAAYLVITDGPAIAGYGISAVCPHLGCIVDWNAEAAKFICPCHNSQFDAEGEVTNGPARSALSRVTVVVKESQVRLVDREPVLDES